MIDPRLLQTFIAVIDTGSFTLAAARLHSTQSTVSQHLARLERAIGFSLVDRAARPVGPTAVGERLATYARRLLSLQEEAIMLLSDPAGTSTIRIGIPDDIVTAQMSRRFSAFAQANRQHRLDVSTGLSRDLSRRYQAGELDIVVVKEPVARAEALASFDEPVMWFESASAAAPLVDPVPLVTFPPGGLYRDLMIERMASDGRRWYVAFTGNSLASVLSAVEAGVGIAILPQSAVRGAAVREQEELGDAPALAVSLYAWERNAAVAALAKGMEEELRATRSN
ncbi:LysR family transcriptional regulator [Sphingomonas sp. IC-11]|uniref:LysR family transcriptional regulator n=1 Tax=Sphingomonas sp. IC-11 TaxID=2898528 RepID=UPI001E622C95|nr:LysR family transcriptional regulator [Sphingomonas sp. IC-11]